MHTRAFLVVGSLVVWACAASGPAADTAPSTTVTLESAGSERAQDPDGLVIGTDACTTDADCVPSGCCHATSCVAAPGPACGEAICTADCRAETIDCGGGCLCHEGRCAARLFRPGLLGVTVE